MSQASRFRAGGRRDKAPVVSGGDKLQEEMGLERL